MIQINNLTFSYSKNNVLRDLSLSLTKGNVYGLLGQNGVGKTTLLKLLAGLQKSTKEACLVNGFHPYARQPEFLQDVFYLPEEPENPLGTVNQFVRNNGPFYRGFDYEQFCTIMERFEVDPRKKFRDLSAGQQKKAHVSYALALNTKILLLDEPSNGMDITSKSVFRSTVAGHISEEQLVIISTHQVRDLENLIDPVIILDQKQVLLHASIEEITQKLCFITASQEPEGVLYSEQTPLGYSLVKANTTGADTKVNLETLFNAALKQREWFKEHFKNGK
ncbi:MAG TPA: ATP-binding cassette domain-containing protein [Bacteroidales bacterium]|nr:ATP-binding cassette domain-containing protein [Bacteroidales bacterium]